LDLESPLKAHVLKASSLGWYCWEVVETLWRPVGGLKVIGDMLLKQIVRPQHPPHFLLLPGHEVSGFVPPYVPAMMPFLTTGPKEWSQLIMDESS
jgi:hypothetical protein